MAQFYGKKSSVMIKVPEKVKQVALESYKLRELSFEGGLSTGWKRAKQLATQKEIPIEDLRYMKAWFARHIITSYPSYLNWVKAGKPMYDPYWHKKRGILAWYIWGGSPAFEWVNSAKNIKLLNDRYPGKNYTRLSINYT